MSRKSRALPRIPRTSTMTKTTRHDPHNSWRINVWKIEHVRWSHEWQIIRNCAPLSHGTLCNRALRLTVIKKENTNSIPHHLGVNYNAWSQQRQKYKFLAHITRFSRWHAQVVNKRKVSFGSTAGKKQKQKNNGPWYGWRHNHRWTFCDGTTEEEKLFHVQTKKLVSPSPNMLLINGIIIIYNKSMCFKNGFWYVKNSKNQNMNKESIVRYRKYNGMLARESLCTLIMKCEK